MHTDSRGSLVEVAPQVFVSTTHPGMTRGNHYHTHKTEKFLVVEGDAVIRLRLRATDVLHEHHVTGNRMQVVNIPTGYVHNIENVGKSDMILVVWVSEIFNPESPDTYPEQI